MMAIENKPLPLMQEIALLYAADYGRRARDAARSSAGKGPPLRISG
jgi:hypothetical protein